MKKSSKKHIKNDDKFNLKIRAKKHVNSSSKTNVISEQKINAKNSPKIRTKKRHFRGAKRIGAIWVKELHDERKICVPNCAKPPL